MKKKINIAARYILGIFLLLLILVISCMTNENEIISEKNIICGRNHVHIVSGHNDSFICSPSGMDDKRKKNKPCRLKIRYAMGDSISDSIMCI